MTGYLVLTTDTGGRPNTTRQDIDRIHELGEQERYLVNIYPQIQYQTICGFGGAITEAVGLVLHGVPEETARDIIRAYYGADGIGYNMIRTHIDSCDFASGNYESVTDCQDPLFRSMDLSHDEMNIIPYIKMAMEESGQDIPVMLSPWSPLSFMKTNGMRNHGGRLLPEYADLWAEYICRYIQEYRGRGVPVRMLSVQNEPHATQTWDSCRYTADEEREFLERSLHPALVRNGLDDVAVYLWDHNKERLFDQAMKCVTPATDSMISGFAFHWYSGDHFDAVRLVREQYPDKDLLFSEGCIEYSLYDTGRYIKDAQMYAHDMIGNFNAGMNSFIDWNILLNKQGGPNHAANYCAAPVNVNEENGEVQYNLSFTYISHFSKYVRPGARHIASTCYADQLEVTAFRNPDQSIVLVLLNRTDRPYPVSARLDDKVLDLEMPPCSIGTLVIE